MASMPGTPRRSGAGRSRRLTGRASGSTRSAKSTPVGVAKSEPSRKKRKYVPGGPGGGGRYVDEDGTEIPVGGTGPGGYNYTGPRGRIGRENAANGVQPVTYPRHDRSTRTRTVLPRSQQPPMRFSSAAQAAAAVVQSDGYKPREERGWEEFHLNLDIDIGFTAMRAKEVDGTSTSRPTTPAEIRAPVNGTNEVHTPTEDVIKTESAGESTPTTSPANDPSKLVAIPGTPGVKRRPGRPPNNPALFYATRMAAVHTPKTPTVAPLPNLIAKERLTLPQPSYKRTDALARYEDKTSGQVRYVERSMANVGYQESDIFIRPERRYIKATNGTIEEDLDLAPNLKSDLELNVAIGSGGVGRVEYDMDEQDDRWLEVYNALRKTMDAEPITREIFEITITKIEKEWHALEKRIPKPNPKPPQTHRPRSSSAAAVNGEPQAGEEQDSKCAICDDGDCENTNAIVFCDGCDLAVHQECYGVPFIPEGQWLCRKCQLIGRGIPTCIFCPNTDGAFKQTNSSKWAHLLCAMWIPEVSLGNHTFMEPVMDVEKVPKTRWKLTCYLCNQKMGACIQCGNKVCYQAFHVTCARKARLYLKMKNSHGTLAVLDGTTVLKAFCDKHCPTDYAKENDVARATREARHFYKKTMKGRLWADSQASALEMAASHRHATAGHPPDESQNTGARIFLALGDKRKGSQPPKSIWKLPSGAPVIPSVLFDSIEISLQRFTIRKRKDFAAETCRYWTLKREARRGAALLKRLQLQMETFSSMEMTRRNFATMGPSGRSRLQRRIDFAQTLISDLERLMALSDDLTKRELEKLRQAELEEEMVDTVYFPVTKLLPPIIEKAITLDIKHIFTSGFTKIQALTYRRHYVLASTFAQDFSAAISAGLATAIAPSFDKTLDDERIENLSPSKRASNDIKERKKLAKRIVKAVQPQLETAIRAEADICKKSAETMIHDLESVLDSGLSARQEPVAGSAISGSIEQESFDAMNIDGDSTSKEKEFEEQRQGGAAEEAFPATELVDADVQQKDDHGENDTARIAPTPKTTNEDDGESISENNVTGGSEVPAPANQDHNRNGIRSKDTRSNTNGYNAYQEHQHIPPPTPPISHGALSSSGQDNGTSEPGNSLIKGGVPWYLSRFDPVGTTVVEDHWSGREAALSEELSDIDDEELRGMGAEMEGLQTGGEEVVVTKPPVVVKAKKAKAKKRWRGYR
ncbi:MAG: nuA3 HAT complex component nto1 [Claussenomyces sp. TS43310]|nr:MAG: nuA3 HAT complex component nto1 [Claussenomyces sp. TS43310]